MKQELISATMLRKRYGQNAVEVMLHVKVIQDTDKKNWYVDNVTNIVSIDAYEKMADAYYMKSVDDLVTGAWGELEELKDELQSWYENLPESLQSSGKADELQDAISTFESMSEPDIPEGLAGLKTSSYRAQKAESRSARCGEAVSQLTAARERVEEYQKELAAQGKTEEAMSAGEFVTVLDDIISEAENVCFPGMY